MSARRPAILFGSVGATTAPALARAAADGLAAGADVIEVRADRWADPAPEPLHAALPAGTPACYTLRSQAQGGQWTGSDSRAVELRDRAAACGFDWVDVEAPAAGPLPPLPPGVRTLCSWHDVAGVPADPAACYARLRTAGADLVKIIGTAREPGDAARLLALLPGHGDLATWCMGAAGLPSRLLAWRAGAAALFGAVDRDAPAAPGQVAVADLRDQYRLATLDAHTVVYGVAGHPVAHSRGPALHNRVFAACDHPAVYLPIDCQDLAAAVAFLGAHGLAGLSVTIPHKAAAARLAGAAADAIVQRSGSANTLRWRDGQLAATSTDGLGLLRALDAATTAPTAGERALILGAGGTAAAVAHALAARGVHVAVTARRDAAADTLATAVGGTAIDWIARHDAAAEILVNATPLGMRPDDPLPCDPAQVADVRVVADAVYTPPETAFGAAARAAGLAVASGVQMFLHQAHAQLEYWGVPARFADVEAAWAACAS